MISLRQLRGEILGVKLSAVQHSLWSIVATVNERGRVAINDAMRTYKFNVAAMYTSAPTNTRTFGVPSEISRVVSIVAVDTDSGRVSNVPEYEFIPTALTPILNVNVSRFPSTTHLEIQYERRAKEFPEDIFVLTPMTTTVRGLVATGTVPSSVWPKNGFLEVSYADTAATEVTYYGCATPTGFSNLIRGVQGEAVAWGAGARLSYAEPLEPEAIAVVTAGAEAGMYNYWIANRAMYDQLSAINAIQQIELEDIVSLVRIMEARANQKYQRSRKAPLPGPIRRR